MRDGSRRLSDTRLGAVTMDYDPGVACLRNARRQEARRIVWIIASNRAAVVHVGDVRDHSESRHSPGMIISPRLSELTSRNALAPVGWLEVMEIALRDGHIVVVVFQLGFSVVIEQPVKQLLIVWPATPSQQALG